MFPLTLIALCGQTVSSTRLKLELISLTKRYTIGLQNIFINSSDVTVWPITMTSSMYSLTDIPLHSVTEHPSKEWSSCTQPLGNLLLCHLHNESPHLIVKCKFWCKDIMPYCGWYTIKAALSTPYAGCVMLVGTSLLYFCLFQFYVVCSFCTFLFLIVVLSF